MRGIPLWLRAYGIDAGAREPGLLHSWHLLNVGGEFWGLVEYVAGNRNATLHLELTELLPSSVLTRRVLSAGTNPWVPGHQ